jgi:hypothetical protein
MSFQRFRHLRCSANSRMDLRETKCIGRLESGFRLGLGLRLRLKLSMKLPAKFKNAFALGGISRILGGRARHAGQRMVG